MILKQNNKKKTIRVLFKDKMVLLKKNTQLMSNGSIVPIEKPKLGVIPIEKEKTKKKAKTKKTTQKKEE